jgi:hypothetical protein
MDVFYIVACYLMNFWKFYITNSKREKKKKKTPGKCTQLSSYSIYIYICAQHDDERRMVYYAWQTDSEITTKSLMRTFSSCYSIYLIFDATSSITIVDKITYIITKKKRRRNGKYFINS